MQIGLVTACTNHTLNGVVHVTKEIHCSWMPLFEPKVFDTTTTIMILSNGPAKKQAEKQ